MNLLQQTNSLFPTMLPAFYQNYNYFFKMFHILIHNLYFNPFPHIDAFWRFCSRQLFENMASDGQRQKEKLLKTSNFSFLYTMHVFNSIQLLLFHFTCLREFPIFFRYVFKVVCCRFVVCGLKFLFCYNWQVFHSIPG